MYEDSDMSLSIQHENLNIEWSGQNYKIDFFQENNLQKSYLFYTSIIQIPIFNFHIKYLINYKSLDEITPRRLAKK